jgi:hypothetical protein
MVRSNGAANAIGKLSDVHDRVFTFVPDRGHMEALEHPVLLQPVTERKRIGPDRILIPIIRPLFGSEAGRVKAERLALLVSMFLAGQAV